MKSISQKDTIFLGAIIAISASVWQIFFAYGAYGEIFFEYIFTIVFVSTSLFIGSFFIEWGRSVIGLYGKAILLIPVCWFMISYMDVFYTTEDFTTIRDILEFLMIVVCLPYIFYLILMITQGDIIGLGSKKLFTTLAIIAIVVAGLGYTLGKYNSDIIYCHDFKISGMEIPLECYSSKEEKIINGTYE